MKSSHAPHPRARSAGFTLVEILVASALSAVVLMASAHAAGMFATQVQALTDDGDTQLEQALATMIHDIRYSWWAEVTGGSATIVSGSSGQETTFSFDSDELTVEHSRGGSDVLLGNLDSATFSAATMTRYREESPLSASEAFWWSSMPATPSQSLVLMAGDSLGLGFTVHSSSPWESSVAGVQEQLLSATLDQLELPLAVLVRGRAQLQLDVYRSRAPGDGRPEGPLLSTKVVPLSTLPLQPFTVFDSRDGLVVPVPVLVGKLWWEEEQDLFFKTLGPTDDVPLSLWGAARPVGPGVSYTLVLSVIGEGAVALRVHPIASANGSGVCLMSDLDKTGILGMQPGAFTPIPYALPRRLRGLVTATDTRAEQVVTRVDIVLRDKAGRTARGSANVSGQTLAENPWLGAIPGELPTLVGGSP